LKCAVRGCTAEENEAAQNLVNEGLLESSVPVQGLPLTNLTVAYYYVEYGTVMAFLSRPNQNYCPEARQVLNEVKALFSYDPIIMSIVADSEGICNRLESGQMYFPTSTPQVTPTPEIETTPTPAP